MEFRSCIVKFTFLVGCMHSTNAIIFVYDVTTQTERRDCACALIEGLQKRRIAEICTGEIIIYDQKNTIYVYGNHVQTVMLTISFMPYLIPDQSIHTQSRGNLFKIHCNWPSYRT